MSTNSIGFPGLGIDTFSMNKVAFSVTLFGKEITVAWYGVILTVAIVLACLYCWRKLTKAGLIDSDHFIDIALWTIPLSILGARLYFVIAQFEDYFLNPNREWWEFLAVWKGGIAIYGAIIAGFLTIFTYTRIKKIKTWDFFDIVAPAVALGQAIGRWANFVNAEAYGIATDLPWRMTVNGHAVHPTFLYESLWNIVGFVALHFILKKKKFAGQIMSLYITWYGLGRFWIEWLRSDSLPYGADFKISQIVAALCVVGGIALYILFARLSKKAAARPIEDKTAEQAENTQTEEILTPASDDVAGDATDITEKTKEEDNENGNID